MPAESGAAGLTAGRPFPVFVRTYRLADGRRIRVVRDDLVPGGTKQRALELILKAGIEYVYPAPSYGYAQIALPCAAAAVGASATIFVAKRNQLHERTARAQAAGATIIEVPHGRLSVVTARARAYTARRDGRELLTGGFDYPEFREALAGIVRGAHIRNVREVWCAGGTGALARTLQMVWPRARFKVVQYGMVPELGRGMELIVAPEAFTRDALAPPPFPSCSNADAKVWQFVERYAADGALMWNVAA